MWGSLDRIEQWTLVQKHQEASTKVFTKSRFFRVNLELIGWISCHVLVLSNQSRAIVYIINSKTVALLSYLKLAQNQGTLNISCHIMSIIQFPTKMGSNSCNRALSVPRAVCGLGVWPESQQKLQKTQVVFYLCTLPSLSYTRGEWRRPREDLNLSHISKAIINHWNPFDQHQEEKVWAKTSDSCERPELGSFG